MNRKINVFKGIFVSLAVVLTACANDQIELMEDAGATLGWSIFAPPVNMNAGMISKHQKELRLDVDWTKSSWGVGITHVLELPIDGRKLKGIRAEIKALSSDKVRVHAGFSNKAGGNLSQDMRLAAEVTDGWKKFEFSVAEMGIDLSEPHSPTFGNRNWDNVKIVNLFFLKPRNSKVQKSTILIRNPILVYSDENVYAKN